MIAANTDAIADNSTLIAGNSTAITDNAALIAANSTAISANDAEIAQIQSDLANVPTADCSCDEYVYHMFDDDGGVLGNASTHNQVGCFGSTWTKSFTFQPPNNPEFTFLNMYIYTDIIIHFNNANTGQVTPTTGYSNLFWKFEIFNTDQSHLFKIGGIGETIDGFNRYPDDHWDLVDNPRSKYSKWKYVGSYSSDGVPQGPTANIGAYFRIRHIVNNQHYYGYGTNVARLVYWWSRN